MTYCSKCGKEYIGGGSFCKHCGEKLSVMQSGIQASSESSRIIKMPNNVSVAIKLIILSLGAGIVRLFIELPMILKISPLKLTIFSLLFSYSIMGLLLYKISKRKNWARIVWTIMFFIGIPFLIIPLIKSLLFYPFSGIIGIGQTIFQLLAIIFLFKKDSTEWFKSSVIMPVLEGTGEYCPLCKKSDAYLDAFFQLYCPNCKSYTQEEEKVSQEEKGEYCPLCKKSDAYLDAFFQLYCPNCKSYPLEKEKVTQEGKG